MRHESSTWDKLYNSVIKFDNFVYKTLTHINLVRKQRFTGIQFYLRSCAIPWSGTAWGNHYQIIKLYWRSQFDKRIVYCIIFFSLTRMRDFMTINLKKIYNPPNNVLNSQTTVILHAVIPSCHTHTHKPPPPTQK